MGVLSISTSAYEDRVLAYALAKENEARAQTGQPAITLDELMRLAFKKIYTDKEQSFALAEAAALTDAYRQADPATQSGVRAALKVTI